MDLRWWPVVAVGLAVLVIGVFAAVRWPARPRQLRRLANTARLTGLPEYQAAVRRRMIATAVAVGLLLVLFGASLVAAARPTAPSPPTAGQARPHDIMLCVGDPVTSPSVGALLGYFAERAATLGDVRIGLTSVNRRVVPMTRDIQYAAGRFGDYASAARQPATDESFAPPVPYVDYRPGTADVLALCMTGFPHFEQPSTDRRTLIYLGPETPGERPLFGAESVQRMASDGGIEVDALVVGGRGGLRALTDDTGGRYLTDPAVAAGLDAIMARPDSTPVAAAIESPDAPRAALTVAVAAAVLVAVWTGWRR
jgi:hypothetical protein